MTRQIFVAVDALVVLFLVAALLLVASRLTRAQARGGDSADATAPVTLPQLTSVRPADAYKIIVANRLFGDAAIVRPPEEPKAAPEPAAKPPEVMVNSELKLLGTSFSDRPNALIARSGDAKVYRPTDEVIPGQVKLLEVHNRWVLLLDMPKNAQQILRMDQVPAGEASAPAIPAANPGGQPGPPGPPNAINVKKQDVAKELENITANLAEIQNTVNPHPAKDASGKTIGFTADKISAIPLAQKMGLKDGDVVTQINGVTIDSQEKITEVIGKFQGSDTFHVRVLRQGKPMLLQYKLTE